jgi:hypothetical protein
VRFSKICPPEEIKTYDDFDKDGKLKETRRIKSTFIVYQLAKGEQVSEFRNVTEFNGKTVARSDGEIEKLFARTSQSEFGRRRKRKNRQGSRAL